MTISDSVLQGAERVLFLLRELYQSFGYHPYRMSKFEEYDLYAGNKDFLVSDNVITFTDIGGKLMALKPDVTLSIIKNSTDAPETTQKVFYNENVYRVSRSTGSFKEIMQAGIECFGHVGTEEISEVLTLAAKSLGAISPGAVLAVSDLDILAGIFSRARIGAELERALWKAIGERRLHEIETLCGNLPLGRTLRVLLTLPGTVEESLARLSELLAGDAAFERFRAVMEALAGTEIAPLLRVDFSVTGDVNYYNGIVCKGFLPELPDAVLSGGQYDKLMRRMGRRSAAIGFAVYTDGLERLAPAENAAEPDPWLNVALPKGRLGEKIYELFDRAGFECPSILDQNRKLIFENPEKRVRYFWVKPSDVAIYVERGAADIGIAGKDILLEYEPDVYELLDLHRGVCRMAVAAPRAFHDDGRGTLRVATKFVNIAKTYYRARGRDIDIIHLNGSIEIAPILGLSDVIVDIVETGATLRENDLEVKEEILPISARLIANRAAAKFKEEQIGRVTEGLIRVMEESK